MSKATCEAARKMPMTFLKEHRYLEPNSLRYGNIQWNINGEPTGSVGIIVSTHSDDMYVRIQCTHTDRYTDEKEDLDYRIRLTTTRPYFGGIRHWFICPLSVNGIPCMRRIGVMYLEGKYFGCRHCYDLAYYSQYDKIPACVGLFGEILRLEGQINEIESKSRVRFWKGRPTKRYARVLKKKRRMAFIAPDAKSEAEMLDRMLRA